MLHKIQFWVTDEEYKTIKEGKGKNKWVDFCMSHPNVQAYIKAKSDLDELTGMEEHNQYLKEKKEQEERSK